MTSHPRRSELALSVASSAVPPELRAQIVSALGKEPVGWHKPHTGLSPARRFVVRFADGSSAFVKAAVDDPTEEWLRTEHEILSRVERTFVPRPLAWIDSGERPALVTEDLSGAHWPADQFPVLWKPGQFGLLFETLRRVAEVIPSVPLPAAEQGFEPQWPLIASEPDAFLALGLCSGDWFRDAIDGLLEAEVSVPLAGDSLVHSDVRSDNLCFVGDRLVLVDWGGALRGNRDHDLATALSTLPLEGGPDPFEVLPHGGPWAVYIAGRAAHRSYRDADAPEWLRRVLRRIVSICLDWAARSLDLPRWTGIHWREIR
jgi:aminoglycoside phosphotransferase (APT) family kinase protein